ncbi:MAG: hypothetical protein ACRCWQ_10210 [Bacilli bacterium]
MIFHNTNKLERAMKECAIDLRVVHHKVLVKTFPGNARVVGHAIDDLHWENVVGTIGGHDTLMVICKDECDANVVYEQLAGMI